ncbi:MAG: metallophosphoesterase [Lachnospiraceae bacterium]|nr:metallophosphoesterase [Lachnospiraceae bacterium]
MRMWPVVIVLALIIIGIAFYFYKFLRRILVTFDININQKKVKIGLTIATICIGLLCIDISGIAALTILHIMMLGFICQLLNFIIKKIFKVKYENGLRLWKKIYGSGIIPVFIAIVLIIYGYFNLRNVIETDYTIYTGKNIRSEGYRVVLIADVHYGVSLNDEEFTAKCKEISEADADIVLLCGDIIDDSTTKAGMEHVFKTLGSIENKLGIYYVYGNHDRPFYSLKYPFSEQDLVKVMETNGITILKDEIYKITDDLTLVGREDKSRNRNGEGRLTIDSLLSNVNGDSFILTMDHQPNEYAENGRAGTDLLVSGHTHGGQIWPVNLIDKLFKINDAVYGHTQIDEDTEAIVTSGFAGWSYPIKTASPAEYVIIDIKPIN